MSIPRLAVQNPIAINLLMWSILISGAWNWHTLIREFFPTLELEQISITVAWPGATPEDVERAIALRIERGVREINDIDEIRTAVFEGVCVLTITLTDDADRDRVLNAVRSEIDQVKPEFPDTADDPEIVEVRPFVPVLSLLVYGDVGEQRLRDQALKVRDDLLDMDNVSEIAFLGLRRREIVAEVAPQQLVEHQLTFEQIGRAVAGRNLDFPGGQLKNENGNVRLRTMGESRTALGVESIAVKTTSDGSIVRLADVADVRDGFEDRVLRGSYRGQPAIQLMVFKTPEQDALKIAGQIKDYVRARPDRLGGAVKIATSTDLSLLIEQRLDLMVRNARAGLILVLLTLSMFLSLRTAFWVAIGLVVALVGTFTVMAAAGTSINLISLFALIIVLGLIVDDAVVIGEAVHRKIQEGLPLAEAAVAGAAQMTGPVVVAVLTSVLAFAPMYFMEGVWGKFLGQIPVVVAAALFVSLIEAFMILPVHLAHSKFLLGNGNGDGNGSGHESGHGHGHGVAGAGSVRRRSALGRIGERVAAVRDEWFDRRLHAVFERSLRAVLRWRYVAIAASVAFFLAVIGLVAGGVVPFVLLQEVDAEMITARLEMAAGTPEARTTEVIEQVSEMARARPEVKSVFSVVGLHLSDRGQSTPADPATVGQISIELMTADEREREGLASSTFIIEQLRTLSANITGVDKLSFRAEAGSPQGAAIEIRVRGDDLERANDAADHVQSVLARYAGVHEIEKDLREGKVEAHLSVRSVARALGVTTFGLASELRNGVFGYEAQELQESDDEVKVRVMLPESARRRLSDLELLRVSTPAGGRIPFSEAADVSTARGYASLSRADGKRAVTVTAEVDETSGANVQDITMSVGAALAHISNDYPGTTIEFAGRQQETQESVGSLFRGFPVALLLIYALIAMLFGSYFQPVLVMMVIPFAFIGAILGHLVMGFPFTLLSVIGGVALAGIVVNDSLILVDCINSGRKNGLPLLEAVVQGATSRLRAILLTTVTTVAGLSPLMAETSFQAQFLIPMAVSIVFGLIFATLLTLMVLPTFYLVIEDLEGLMRWAWTGRWKRAKGAAV